MNLNRISMARKPNNTTQELTRAELEVMQILWKKEKVFVKDILEDMPEPKPAYNTVSTVIRVLEKKGFVGHISLGSTYQYYPLVEKGSYTKSFMGNVLNNFFGGSFSQMVCFFNDSKSITIDELEDVVKIIKEKK